MKRLLSKTNVAIVVTALIAGVTGAGIAVAIMLPQSSTASAALEASERERQLIADELDATTQSLADAEASNSEVLDEIENRERALSDRASRLDAREAALAALESAAQGAARFDLRSDVGLCAADAELTNLELNDALAPILGFPSDRDDRSFDQDEQIRVHKNAAFARACPARVG